MFVSLNYRYQKYGIKVLFYILGASFLFASVMTIPSLPSSLVPLIIMLVLSFGSFFLAIFLSKLSKGTKKLYKKGQSGFFGEVVSKSDRRIFAFYYKLEDGRIGKTTQKISKKSFEKIVASQFNKVPIVICNQQAVLDQDMIEKDEYILPLENLNISGELIEVKSEFHIGSLAHGLIWYILAFLSAFFVVALLIYGRSQAVSVFAFAPVIILLLLNPFTVVFFIIGAVVSRNYYYVSKITYEATKNDPDPCFRKVDGTVLPLVNTEKKNEKFTKGSEAAFIYQDKDGNYHKTIQSLSAVRKAEVNDGVDDKVTLYVWDREDNKHIAILGKPDTSWLRRRINNIKQYNLAFYAALAVNVYLLVMELINVIGAKFLSGLSNFGAIVYFLTIIYTLAMFLIEKLVDDKKKGLFYAYSITLFFLVTNLVVLPGIYAFGGFNDEVAFLVKIQSIFNTMVMNMITIFIYLAYLFVKFIYAIMKAHQAKALGEHYDRCLSFGDIISGFFTVLVFVAHLLVIVVYGGSEGAAVVTFQESTPIQVVFILMLAGMTILDLIMLIQCAVQMKHFLKNKKKEPKALENKE